MDTKNDPSARAETPTHYGGADARAYLSAVYGKPVTVSAWDSWVRRGTYPIFRKQEIVIGHTKGKVGAPPRMYSVAELEELAEALKARDHAKQLKEGK